MKFELEHFNKNISLTLQNSFEKLFKFNYYSVTSF